MRPWRCNRQVSFGSRHWPTRSTSARHRIRHGIRHTLMARMAGPCATRSTAGSATCCGSSVAWNVVLPGHGLAGKVAAGFKRKLSSGSVVMTEYAGPGTVGVAGDHPGCCRVPATLSAVTVCAASSISSAEAMRSSGTSSSFTASVFSSAVGNQQWPSPMASVSANAIPARTWIIAVFSMPSRSAIRSAVRKPMPLMSRASR